MRYKVWRRHTDQLLATGVQVSDTTPEDNIYIDLPQISEPAIGPSEMHVICQPLLTTVHQQPVRKRAQTLQHLQLTVTLVETVNKLRDLFTSTEFGWGKMWYICGFCIIHLYHAFTSYIFVVNCVLHNSVVYVIF